MKCLGGDDLNIINNRKGSALIVAILVLAVLMILSTTMVSISSSNFEMSHAERRYLSAYYVAEAGIRHQIEHMRTRFEELQRSGVSSADAFFSAFNGTGLTAAPLILPNQLNDTARADIVMTTLPFTGNPRMYEFTSTATVGNLARRIRGSVTIRWARMQPPPDYFRFALFSRGSVAVSGNPTITGGIGTNAASVTISGNPNISGGTHTNLNLPMPAVVLPQGLPLRTDLNIKNNDDEIIATNGRYNVITLNGTLRFDLSKGDLLIQVTTLTMNSGTIKTFGAGRLYFFVNGNLALSGNDHINIGRANHMVMYLTGSSIAFSGNAIFAGGLYAPNAALAISGTGEFTGGLMVNTASISGNPDISHAPITPTGISTHLGAVPDFVPPEHMFTINPWQEQ